MKTLACALRAGAASGSSQKLRVMTYNVLAQCYVRSTFFPYCKSSELRWKNRSKNLEAVFSSSLPVAPDVICLQEVDNYNEFWADAMKRLGYEGLFVKKTSTKPDGVAVLWNAKKLKVRESTQLSLTRLTETSQTSTTSCFRGPPRGAASAQSFTSSTSIRHWIL
ncbi:Glucose-repressible alcohol dehydrogenase transcriptional effector CCR4 [Phytophthora cinnamomi]|uniref:Glucose-repressible alcohol dehydrogenase transcriptional effector CCR4 n=1 Tax=Phytophthora cinnamomi TaxID=4785 RepID=UPI00355A1E29|nr:Glucose-repressible alcohol dehydrogenase transcriptional effector CCR4 [Phytophthora cinnamomi]